MTPATIIEHATADGVTLALTSAGTIKATGQGDAVRRWVPILTEHKPSIVAALREVANDPGTHYRWRLTLPDRAPLEICSVPEMTAAEVIARYPGANIEPLADSPQRTATPAEAAELRLLIELVLADAPHEWDEVHEIACRDPEWALTSFRLLADEARERAIWGQRARCWCRLPT